MIEGMRKEYTSLFTFCVWMDKPIAYVPSYKRLGSKPRSSGKKIQKKQIGGLIGPKALRSFVIKGRKLNLKNHKSTM